MLNINYYVKKQFLVISLDGMMIKKNKKKFSEINQLIMDLKIKNIIFDITSLIKIDIIGLNTILICYDLVSKYSGKDEYMI